MGHNVPHAQLGYMWRHSQTKLYRNHRNRTVNGHGGVSVRVKPATPSHLVGINTECSCTATHPTCLHIVNRNNLTFIGPCIIFIVE